MPVSQFCIFHVSVSWFYTEIVIVDVQVGVWAAKATLRLGLQHPPHGTAPVALGSDFPPIMKTILANTAKMSLSRETFYTDASLHLAALESNLSTSHTSGSTGTLTALTPICPHRRPQTP